MRDRFQITPSIFAALINAGQVFLIKRKNTGFLDGYYDLPGGHLEVGENLADCAVRELEEEVGVQISTDKIELFHICQSDATEEWPYIYFIFKASSWAGQPHNAEPDKAEEAAFYPLDKLPPKLTPHTVAALKQIKTSRVSFSYLDHSKYEGLGQ